MQSKMSSAGSGVINKEKKTQGYFCFLAYNLFRPIEREKQNSPKYFFSARKQNMLDKILVSLFSCFVNLFPVL